MEPEAALARQQRQWGRVLAPAVIDLRIPLDNAPHGPVGPEIELNVAGHVGVPAGADVGWGSVLMLPRYYCRRIPTTDQLLSMSAAWSLPRWSMSTVQRPLHSRLWNGVLPWRRDCMAKKGWGCR